VLPITTASARVPPFSIYSQLTEQGMVKRGSGAIKRNVICSPRAYARGEGKGENGRGSRVDSDLAIFPPSVYIYRSAARQEVHSSMEILLESSLPKADAYKSTVPPRAGGKKRLKPRLPRGIINCDRGKRKTEGRRGRRWIPPALSAISDRIFNKYVFFFMCHGICSLSSFSVFKGGFARGF